DQLVETIDKGLSDIALELRLRTDLHEIGRDAGVRADKALSCLRHFGALQQHVERFSSPVAAFDIACPTQRVLGVLRNLPQGGAVETRAHRLDQLIGDRHRRLRPATVGISTSLITFWRLYPTKGK